MTHKINLVLALGVLIAVSVACNFSFSTANLSELKFGKDKDAAGAGTSFKPEDEIFAVTAVNNSMGTNKAKFRLLVDKVEGMASGTVAYKIEQEMTVEGSREVWMKFSVPGGFNNGSYKVETVLTDDSGKELDRKSGTFTIAGGNPAKPAESSKKPADETKPDADKEADKDSEAN